jgi:hypothetical protein
VFVSQIKDLLGIPKAKKYEGILKIPYVSSLIINTASIIVKIIYFNRRSLIWLPI